MKRRIAITALAVVALSACGKTETVYVERTDAPSTEAPSTEAPSTEAPTTTVKRTTDAPIAMSAEDMFLLGVSVSYDGQIYVSEQEMIDTGRAVCNALDLGATGMDVALAMVDASAGDASTSEFLTAVTASAVANFCPEHAWKFM